MPRSRKKGYFRAESVHRKVQVALAKNSKSPIKVMSRASMIVPDDVALNFLVHNGKNFIPLLVTEGKIGRKFGEFVPTKRFGGHSGGAADAKKAQMKKK